MRITENPVRLFHLTDEIPDGKKVRIGINRAGETCLMGSQREEWE
jgi:hypothetical protein